jgi:hypothetical protein
MAMSGSLNLNVARVRLSLRETAQRLELDFDGIVTGLRTQKTGENGEEKGKGGMGVSNLLFGIRCNNKHQLLF